MTDTQSNAARVRAAYANWQDTLGRDPEPFFALMGDGFEMSSVLDPPHLNELAANHRGPGRVRDYFAALDADWEMIDFPTEQVVAEGDTVVWIGRCTWRNRHTGTVVGTPKVDIWTFRDGRAVGMLELFDTLGFARGAGLLPQLAAEVG